MNRSKTMKITALAACMSLVAAIPVFADSSQGFQNMNTLQFQNGQMQMQNGQMQNGQMQNGMQQQQLSNAAQFMINKGIIKGSSDGNYAMSDNVKRCDMSLMLTRAFNLSGSGNSSGFNDVAQGSYYYEAVNTMQSLGIALGDGQNFSPSRNMTLEEAILFIERALEAAGIDYDESDLTSLFEDRSLSEYATREDVAALLYAVLGEDYTGTTAAAVTAADTIAYSADEDNTITFDEDDFNDACSDATDGTLDYVIFANPSSSLGRLYYDYTSSSDYDSKVDSSTKYYYDSDDGDPLSDVTFVPASNMYGSVNIGYTGYDTDGNSFHGTVKITINKDEDAVADTITYETDEETAVTFDEDDFNDACEDATDETLSYIKFTLPSTTYGKLYYGYDDEDDYDGKVTSAGKYYYDDDDHTSISDITFVPTDDYTGTVKIKYTGYTEDGNTYTGTVKITVE